MDETAIPLTRKQRWYRKNNGKEKSREYVRIFRDKNPEAAKAHSRLCYAKHIEERRESKREYDRTVVKERRRTPEGRAKERMKKAKRRAILAGVTCDFTWTEWVEILTKHNHRCAYCGTTGDMEQDHVVPITKGGGHTKSNIVPACKPCNSSKGNRFDRPMK